MPINADSNSSAQQIGQLKKQLKKHEKLNANKKTTNKLQRSGVGRQMGPRGRGSYMNCKWETEVDDEDTKHEEEEENNKKQQHQLR